jgi:hypothetical protein
MENKIMITEQERQLNEVLTEIAKSLDISPSDFKRAEERYKAVGKWLEEGYIKECYPKSNGMPEIYPQGSMRLGTVVRPLREGKEADFDIDLVCQFDEEKENENQQLVKQQTGDRLKDHADYKRMLTPEGKRCWTLEYAEDSNGCGFHLDVLPCVPDPFYDAVPHSNHAVAITDKDKGNNLYSWKGGNPRGYANWFDDRQKSIYEAIFESARSAVFNSNREIFASVEAVPNSLIKTPLQMTIQLLKRHRDSTFVEHPLEEYKPISMIITTLAAIVYNGETDVLSFMNKICSYLDAYSSLLDNGSVGSPYSGINLIQKRNGEWWIPNPVNPEENFADRWNESGSKRPQAFFYWASCLKNDLNKFLNKQNILMLRSDLSRCFGEKYINKAFGAALSAGHTLNSSSATSHSTSPMPVKEIKSPSRPWGEKYV